MGFGTPAPSAHPSPDTAPSPAKPPAPARLRVCPCWAFPVTAPCLCAVAGASLPCVPQPTPEVAPPSPPDPGPACPASRPLGESLAIAAWLSASHHRPAPMVAAGPAGSGLVCCRRPELLLIAAHALPAALLPEGTPRGSSQQSDIRPTRPPGAREGLCFQNSMGGSDAGRTGVPPGGPSPCRWTKSLGPQVLHREDPEAGPGFRDGEQRPPHGREHGAGTWPTWWWPVCVGFTVGRPQDPRHEARGTCGRQVLTGTRVRVDGSTGPRGSKRGPGHVSGGRTVGAGPAGWSPGVCADVTSPVSPSESSRI